MTQGTRRTTLPRRPSIGSGTDTQHAQQGYRRINTPPLGQLATAIYLITSCTGTSHRGRHLFENSNAIFCATTVTLSCLRNTPIYSMKTVVGVSLKLAHSSFRSPTGPDRVGRLGGLTDRPAERAHSLTRQPGQFERAGERWLCLGRRALRQQLSSQRARSPTSKTGSEIQ